MAFNTVVAEDLELIFNSSIDWAEFSGKSILISGASGFLPAYLVETFLYLNTKNIGEPVRIFALVRNERKAKSRFSQYKGDCNLTFIIQDVCEEIYFDKSINIDIIIHAASQASPKYYGIDPVGTLNANVIGTYNLLKLAREKEVKKFLFFSSSEVYGQVSENKIPTREVDYGYLEPSNVRACYAEGKRLGETMCISWMHQFKIPVVIVRPFHTYGPGMDLDDGRVYADFIADIVRGKDIVMKSDGSAVRAFCYISDATLSFLMILQKGVDGEPYNMGNPMGEISIINLAHKLVSLFPERALKVIKKSTSVDGYINSFVSRISPNIEKLEMLGWKPIVGLEEGFSRTIKSYN
jgi:UDP-glucuronate decarboxylase